MFYKKCHVSILEQVYKESYLIVPHDHQMLFIQNNLWTTLKCKIRKSFFISYLLICHNFTIIHIFSMNIYFFPQLSLISFIFLFDFIFISPIISPISIFFVTCSEQSIPFFLFFFFVFALSLFERFLFFFCVTFMFSTVYSGMWSSPTSCNNIFKEFEKWESRRRWSSKQDFFFLINWGLFDSVLFRDNLIWCHVIFPKKQKLTYNYFI